MTWLKDLLNLEILEWIISPFKIEMERANLDPFSEKKEFIEMTFDLEMKSMYRFKGIGYWRNEKKTIGSKISQILYNFWGHFTHLSMFIFGSHHF